MLHPSGQFVAMIINIGDALHAALHDGKLSELASILLFLSIYFEPISVLRPLRKIDIRAGNIQYYSGCLD
jgi:hypothetical protein